MIDKSKFQNLKGRRIYLFWLDENTGEITDVTSRSDVVQVIRCKDCKYNNGSRCGWHGGAGYKWIVDDDDYCSCAERKE